MTFWQYVGAIAIVCAFLLMVFAGVFEWLAHRDQDEPRDKNLREYYEEHPDEQPKG
jgi:cytochrome b